MAAFVTQPNVVDFVDVVMHDGTSNSARDLMVSSDSHLVGSTLRSAHLRDRTGALVLAIRRPTAGSSRTPRRGHHPRQATF